MSLSSLKNLPLAATGSSPLPSDVQQYYLTTLAQGSGPNGTFLVTDFFGTAAGLPSTEYLSTVNTIIAQRLADGTLTNLNVLYGQLLDTVTGVYGTPPTIVIPSGPAAGTYADYDSAVTALVSAINSAIAVANTVMAADAVTMNAAWQDMVSHFANESVNQTRASVSFTTIPGDAQLPVTAFMTALNGYGVDTQQGMSAQFLESIADLTNRAGQAMVGALREGRNNASMDADSVGHDNVVPDLPSSAPPQATLINSQYTVTEARALVQSRLAP
jgi:hypothetical protein